MIKHRQKQTAPYGSWKSPITADMIAAGKVSLGQIVLDGPAVYWTEGRPTAGGRNVAVRWIPGAETQDLTPTPFNIRTRVHEYGGGAYTVRDGLITFANFSDQRLYQQRAGETPIPVTPEEEVRYADGVFTPDNFFICVREDHRVAGHEAINSLVSLRLDGQDIGQIIVSGHDFYASPRISPDGRYLAWLAWNHPNMPWDGTELWVANLHAGGLLTNPRHVAGGREESIFQPEWSADNVLHFVSDRSGWWNLYRLQGEDYEALCPKAAEFGLPQWMFGMRSYDFLAADKILCAITQDGRMSLGVVDCARKKFEPLALPFTYIRGLRTGDEAAYFLAAAPDLTTSLIRLDLVTLDFTILKQDSDDKVPAGYISLPQQIEFPTSGGQTAHAIFYPPQNEDYQPAAGELPPCIVMSHGGPTSAVFPLFSYDKLYWTSRGFAVLDVNYRGSTGYGRVYRQRLNGNWGIADVQDCVNGAGALVERGLVDGQRLAIRGASAGGYTTLCALTFYDEFRVGASYFGVSDLEALAKETHKFESRYTDNLVGPYPDRRDLYLGRSPIHFTERINCPMIFLQGLEDRVVTPNQAEKMFESLKGKGIPVAYLPFAGEQHGFRRAENIKRALEAEYYFYAQVFGFATADPIAPVLIENL